MVAWFERKSLSPFGRSRDPRPAEEDGLRDADGLLTARAEVAWLNRLAGAEKPAKRKRPVELETPGEGPVKHKEPSGKPASQEAT